MVLLTCPEKMTATTPRDKTTIADHNAIDILCYNLRQKVTNQYALQISHISSKLADEKRTPEQ
jgi:hypothetical protein